MIDVNPELLSFLRAEYDRCLDETLEDERTTAIDRYNGEPYGDEEDGRSQVVARDTAEVTDYMVISILRTIVSGDRIVEFLHRDSDAAHKATETIMHLLMDEQDGYSVLHDWLKAGLLEKNAVAMTYPEPRPPKRRVLEGITDMQLVQLQEQGANITEAELVEESVEGAILNVTVMEEQPPKFCDAAVPNEEFYCSPDARTITEARLKGRRVRKSLSDLVEMGHDKDDIEALADTNGDNELSVARDEDRFVDTSNMGQGRLIWWHEEWARFDANEDGIAELLYIQRTSDYKVFSIEEMEDDDDHPFEDWCPFPMQHRRIGQSLFDKVADIERVRTVLFRQALDGIYLANNPSTYVHEDAIGENTIDDLLTVRPGRLVRWRGAVPPTERSGNFDPTAGFTMLEFMNGERESRTGITRLNQGLDADALNKTATGTALMQAQGQQVEEYLARNFANALSRLFTKKARMLKRYGATITVPIDGEYVEVDPSQWPDDMIARPRVGLGSGKKDQRLQYRRELMGYQTAAFDAGMSIVDEKKFYNTAKGFISDANLGDVGEYFNDPDKPEIDPNTGQPIEKAEKPDPAAQQAEMEAQLKAQDQQARQAEVQAKLQIQQAEGQAKMQFQQAEAQAKLELAREEAGARIQATREESNLKAQLERERAEFEASLAMQKMEREFALAERQMELNARLTAQRDQDANIQKNRRGGDLDK